MGIIADTLRAHIEALKASEARQERELTRIRQEYKKATKAPS